MEKERKEREEFKKQAKEKHDAVEKQKKQQ